MSLDWSYDNSRVEEHLVRLQSDDCNLAIDLHSECVDTALSWHGDECKLQERHKDGGRMEMSSLKNRSMCLSLICWSTHKWEKTASWPSTWAFDNPAINQFSQKGFKLQKNLPNSWLKYFFGRPDRVSSDFYWPCYYFLRPGHKYGKLTYVPETNAQWKCIDS